MCAFTCTEQSMFASIKGRWAQCDLMQLQKRAEHGAEPLPLDRMSPSLIGMWLRQAPEPCPCLKVQQGSALSKRGERAQWRAGYRSARPDCGSDKLKRVAHAPNGVLLKGSGDEQRLLSGIAWRHKGASIRKQTLWRSCWRERERWCR